MRALISLGSFLTICFSGVFVGLAGGVEWGTPVCGLLALMTLFLALLSVVAIYVEEIGNV